MQVTKAEYDTSPRLYAILTIEHRMLQFNAKLILGNEPHLPLNIVLHSTAKSKDLSNLACIKYNITAEEYESKEEVLPSIDKPLAEF